MCIRDSFASTWTTTSPRQPSSTPFIREGESHQPRPASGLLELLRAVLRRACLRGVGGLRDRQARPRGLSEPPGRPTLLDPREPPAERLPRLRRLRLLRRRPAGLPGDVLRTRLAAGRGDRRADVRGLPDHAAAARDALVPG